MPRGKQKQSVNSTKQTQASIQKAKPAPTGVKLTSAYRAANEGSKVDAPLADQASEAAAAIAETAKQDPDFFTQAYEQFPDVLKTALRGYAKSTVVSAAANYMGISPLHVAVGSLLYTTVSANAAPISETAASASEWVFGKKYHDSYTGKGICSARNFADRCGRFHLDVNGANVIPAATREIDAHTTSDSHTWGGWFTIRDCFTKSKVQNTLKESLEEVGLEDGLREGSLCSFVTSKFRENQMGSNVMGLSPEACTVYAAKLNKISKNCENAGRANGIDFGLACAGVASLAVGFCMCVAGLMYYPSVKRTFSDFRQSIREWRDGNQGASIPLRRDFRQDF